MTKSYDWGFTPLLPNLQVIEKDDRPAIVFDHNGQPWARPKQPMGFIDPNNLPKKNDRK